MNARSCLHRALVLALLVAAGSLMTGSAFATPIPESAVINTRIFDDCPFSTLTVVNDYPTSVLISDEGLGCGGFANLHNWRFSEDGLTEAVFNNDHSFTFSADLVISGTGNGEAGLQIAPWWSKNVDGRFNVRSTDGEIACFGGRLPFFSFTGTHGVHYMKGDPIRLEVAYRPNELTMAAPATIEYKLTYLGTSYSSGPLPFDQGNPAEDPPYGLWGMLNDGRAGGYFQAFLTPGDYTTGVTAHFSNVSFNVTETPDPDSAVLNLRIFDDCPFSTLTTVNDYPMLVSITDEGLGCGGFANLHNWQFSEDGMTPALFYNGSSFKFSADLMISGTGEGEAGLMISPWWSPNVDGRFNVRSTDGEIACFGGRLPFYSFTGTHGVHYMKGETIRLEAAYLPNGLSMASPGTIEYKLTYMGMTYSSGPLPFDMANPNEDPPHGLWGILTPARAGGYMQAFLTAGNYDTGLSAAFSNIGFASLPLDVIEAAMDVKPGSCDNPLSPAAKGALPVALLGSEMFDVSQVDVSTIALEGVAPRGWDFEYVYNATTPACGDCAMLPEDDFLDLVLRFKAPSIVSALMPFEDETATLTLTGMMLDGTPFEAVDCVQLVGNMKHWDDGNGEPAFGFQLLSAPTAPVQILGYSVPEEGPVRVSVYDVAGRLVRELVRDTGSAGNHTVSWDASAQPSGVYFYRFESVGSVSTIKGIILR